MTRASYGPPLDRLLALGEPPLNRDRFLLPSSCNHWPNYVADFGLGPEHVADLIRIATNLELSQGEAENPETWAPVHAWRALGQLRGEAAIEPLIPLFHELDDDEWMSEELPEVYGMIGSAAIPALTAYLADPSRGLYPRYTAARSLESIGIQHPDARDRCVAAITRELEKFAENDRELNGFLLCPLTRLKAVESAPLIERAFVADRIDESIAGDWEDVQIMLGLKARRETPVKRRDKVREKLLSSLKLSGDPKAWIAYEEDRDRQVNKTKPKGFGKAAQKKRK